MQKLILKLFIGTLLLQADDAKLEQQVESTEKVLNFKQDSQLQQALSKTNSFNQKDFLPDIALIINSSTVSRDIQNSKYGSYGIDGFIDKMDDIPFNRNRGFNLNYAEYAMHSTVGPYFDADAIFHLHPDEFEIEEAYMTTKKLPANLDIKVGQFRSNFGRINSIHQHAQHFIYQPLVYEAMLGVEGIKDAGIGVHWVAPIDNYLMFGIEALQGSNEFSFGYQEGNSLFIEYIKAGFDIGDNTSILTGTSIANGKTLDNRDSSLYNMELTLKYIIDSYSNLSWQSEYLYRDREKSKQEGFYSQLVYDMNSNWEFGTRYDIISGNLQKYSLMIDYKPFEFSKIRLQYVYDKSKSFGGKREDEQEILLDLTIESGSHGAHAF